MLQLEIFAHQRFLLLRGSRNEPASFKVRHRPRDRVEHRVAHWALGRGHKLANDAQLGMCVRAVLRKMPLRLPHRRTKGNDTPAARCTADCRAPALTFKALRSSCLSKAAFAQGDMLTRAACLLHGNPTSTGGPGHYCQGNIRGNRPSLRRLRVDRVLERRTMGSLQLRCHQLSQRVPRSRSRRDALIRPHQPPELWLSCVNSLLLSALDASLAALLRAAHSSWQEHRGSFRSPGACTTAQGGGTLRQARGEAGHHPLQSAPWTTKQFATCQSTQRPRHAGRDFALTSAVCSFECRSSETFEDAMCRHARSVPSTSVLEVLAMQHTLNELPFR